MYFKWTICGYWIHLLVRCAYNLIHTWYNIDIEFIGTSYRKGCVYICERMCMTMATCFDTFNSILSYDGKYCMFLLKISIKYQIQRINVDFFLYKCAEYGVLCGLCTRNSNLSFRCVKNTHLLYNDILNRGLLSLSVVSFDVCC